MIELISESRCTSCNRCVDVCPTNVFDIVQGGIPVIARPDSCQTCFLCELYCPVDAMYVHPCADVHVTVDESALVAEGRLGGYSASLGWRKARAQGTEQDQMDRIFALGVY
ncbi:Ferredoxin [plant metagenome]|uniref:Ferredoxin n=2 Tax=root TaxID=1 RepID=A0A1C3JZH4_9BURK|nr:ferredoxin family protein [Orrella dioscoreae]SBT24662.1 Ferredoxin [Orrella dioscoreae]SOE50354.1 Ferredoxin [Orrella dioscoreae]